MHLRKLHNFACDLFVSALRKTQILRDPMVDFFFFVFELLFLSLILRFLSQFLCARYFRTALGTTLEWMFTIHLIFVRSSLQSLISPFVTCRSRQRDLRAWFRRYCGARVVPSR